MSTTTGEKAKTLTDAITVITKSAGEISKAAKEGEKVASTVMEVLGAIGKFSPYFAVAGSVLSVFNLFAPNPFQTEVINYLKDIDGKLDDLENHIDQQLENLGHLIDLDFFKQQLKNRLSTFNIDMTNFPIGYNSDDLSWSNFVNLDGTGMSVTYKDIYNISPDIGQNISNIRTQLTGDPNANPGQSEATNSVLGLMVEKAIRDLDGTKGIDQRGCMQSSDALLNCYLAIESFFCQNFLIQFKSYKMWHDAVIYMNSFAYPLTDPLITDDTSNIRQILKKDTTTYSSKGAIPDYICVGTLGASSKYKPGDKEYAIYNLAINNWGGDALQKSVSYTPLYQDYLQEFKEGKLAADNPLFLFIHKETLIKLLKAQEALADQLNMFVFQVERLVVSQMNLASAQSPNNQIADFLSKANEILSRAEYIRQSLSGDVYQILKDTDVKPGDGNTAIDPAISSEPPFLTGRVILPNNVQPSSGSIGKTGDLGTAVLQTYTFGYGYDGTAATGFGYQFPIVDERGAIRDYADSWMAMYAYNFKPEATLPDLTNEANQNVLINLAGGNFNKKAQGGTIYVNTFTMGSTSKTLYGFFVTPLFGGLEAAALLGKNYKDASNYDRSGIWIHSFEADMNALPLTVTMKGSTPSGDHPNGADFSDFLTLGFTIPISFNGIGMHTWVKGSMAIDVNFDVPFETHLEELTMTTCFMEGYQFYDFYQSADDDQHTDGHWSIIGNSSSAKINSATSLGTGFEPSTSSQMQVGNNLTTVGSKQSFGSSGNLKWALDAMGGPNDPLDYTFNGSFTVTVTIDEIRLFWDMPDTTKF